MGGQFVMLSVCNLSFIIKGFKNAFSRRVTGFHRQANLTFELKFYFKKFSRIWSNQVGNIIAYRAHPY